MRRISYVQITALCLLSQSACLGMMAGNYTLDQVHTELAAYTPTLPMAELVPGTGETGTARIIKLQGQNSFFNSAPVLDAAWLAGKMTQDEYHDAIASIDEAVGQSMVGMPRAYSPSDIPARSAKASAAASQQVQALNGKWNGRKVTFTLQVGGQQAQVEAVGDRNGVGEQTRHWQDTTLYIKIDK